ncbi:unnamed protein product [Leptosia nina]|uniref:MADF domain-containing protein n=1 Tax=Leptosia nina TaxID=320188 RepID=A0AAV1IZL0_9NEOP
MLSEFEKEKVFWTRNMNLNLVKFIQSKPNIWHPKHPKYTSSAAKDHTFAEFAAKYGNQFSGEAVRGRWTNIRSTFAYYLRKVKQNEDYKVKWPLWEPCQFLLKIGKITIQEMPSENKEISIEDFSDSVEQVDDCKSDDFVMDNNCLYDSRVSCQGVAESILNIFQGVQNDAFGLVQSRNGMVGKAVTEQLSKLNSLEATKMSMKIINILCLYDQSNPMNPNNIKSEEY